MPNWTTQFESEKAAFQRALGRITHESRTSAFEDLAQHAAECQALEIAAKSEVWAAENSDGDTNLFDKTFAKVMNQRLLDSLSVFGCPRLAKALAGILRRL